MSFCFLRSEMPQNFTSRLRYMAALKLSESMVFLQRYLRLDNWALISLYKEPWTTVTEVIRNLYISCFGTRPRLPNCSPILDEPVKISRTVLCHNKCLLQVTAMLRLMHADNFVLSLGAGKTKSRKQIYLRLFAAKSFPFTWLVSTQSDSADLPDLRAFQITA